MRQTRGHEGRMGTHPPGSEGTGIGWGGLASSRADLTGAAIVKLYGKADRGTDHRGKRPGYQGHQVRARSVRNPYRHARTSGSTPASVRGLSGPADPPRGGLRTYGPRQALKSEHSQEAYAFTLSARSLLVCGYPEYARRLAQAPYGRLYLHSARTRHFMRNLRGYLRGFVRGGPIPQNPRTLSGLE